MAVSITSAVTAIVVALMSLLIARSFVGRDRKRQLYGEAYKTALEWREMVYRLRRRDNTREHDRLLTDRFHDLEERLDFYNGWIGSESLYMRRSYEKLVADSKQATLALIRDAWDVAGRAGNADPSDVHPTPSPDLADAFLRDVRSHLSFQPWRWAAVVIRNRKGKL